MDEAFSGREMRAFAAQLEQLVNEMTITREMADEAAAAGETAKMDHLHATVAAGSALYLLFVDTEENEPCKV